MLKISLYVLVFIALIIGGAGWYHVSKVKAKSKAEMANYAKDVAITADLGNVLVVYYSFSGHTKKIAEQIAEKTNADTFEIKTKEAYSSPSVYAKSKKELSSKNYPAINSEDMPDVQAYDTIIIGAPVWWFTMAPALFKYLSLNNLDQKRVAAFSTQGSNYGSFFEDFATMAKGAKILPSININNAEEAYPKELNNKLNTWLNKLSQ